MVKYCLSQLLDHWDQIGAVVIANKAIDVMNKNFAKAFDK